LPTISQTVLVLEDDESSCFVLRAIMEEGGFKVVESIQPTDAINICSIYPEAIAVTICDVLLRESHGPKTVRELKTLRPNMAVLFVSGYPLELLQDRGMLDSRDLAENRTDFLQKPFTAQTILSVVRELITARSRCFGDSV
jgi:two-component system cell cycle sensor histidine kinase/response regulator CckA